jgi:mersacidin/lichenicidin family type 2 lantibiotic
MSKNEIIRAWQDEEYREGLGEAALAALPGNPAGPVELDEALLDAVAGARPRLTTGGACYSYRTTVLSCGGC